MDALKVKVNVISKADVEVMELPALREFAGKIAQTLSAGFLDLWKLGQQMVFTAYGRCTSDDKVSEVGGQLSDIINLFDGAPSVQEALYSYMKRAGINASRPAPGTKKFLIGGPLDRGYQDKAFDYVRRTPPVAIERKIATVKAPATLKGTAVERARTKASSIIKAMAKLDPDGAAALNEMLQQHDSCIFDAQGTKVLVDKEELTIFAEVLTKRTEGEWLGFRSMEDVAAKIELSKMKEVQLAALKLVA